MTPEEKRKLEIIKGILEDLKAITKAENISADNMTVGIDDMMVIHRESEATA